MTALVKGWAYLGHVEEPATPKGEVVGGSLTEAVIEDPMATETGVAAGSGGEKVKAKKMGLKKRKWDGIRPVAKRVWN